MSAALTAFRASAQASQASRPISRARSKSAPRVSTNNDAPRKQFVNPYETLNITSPPSGDGMTMSPSEREPSTFGNIETWIPLRQGPAAGTRALEQPHNFAAPTIEDDHESEIQFESISSKEAQRLIAQSNPHIDVETFQRQVVGSKKDKFIRITSEELIPHVVRLWDEFRKKYRRRIMMDKKLRLALRGKYSHISDRGIALARWKLSAKKRRQKYPFAYNTEGTPYEEWKTACEPSGDTAMDDSSQSDSSASSSDAVEPSSRRSSYRTRSQSSTHALPTPPDSSSPGIGDDPPTSPHHRKIKPERMVEPEAFRPRNAIHSDPEEWFVQNKSSFLESCDLRRSINRLTQELGSRRAQKTKLKRLFLEQTDAYLEKGAELEKLRKLNRELLQLLGRGDEEACTQSSEPTVVAKCQTKPGSDKIHDRCAQPDNGKSPNKLPSDDLANGNSSAITSQAATRVHSSMTPATVESDVAQALTTSPNHSQKTANPSKTASEDGDDESSDTDSDCSASEESVGVSDDDSVSDSPNSEHTFSGLSSSDEKDDSDCDSLDDGKSVASGAIKNTTRKSTGTKQSLVLSQSHGEHTKSQDSAPRKGKDSHGPKARKRKHSVGAQPTSDATASSSEKQHNHGTFTGGESQKLATHNEKRRKQTHTIFSGVGESEDDIRAGFATTSPRSHQPQTPKAGDRNRTTEKQGERQKRQQKPEDQNTSARPRSSSSQKAHGERYEIKRFDRHGRLTDIEISDKPPNIGLPHAIRNGSTTSRRPMTPSSRWNQPQQGQHGRPAGGGPNNHRNQKRSDRRKRNRAQSGPNHARPAWNEKKEPPTSKERNWQSGRGENRARRASTDGSGHSNRQGFHESLNNVFSNVLEKNGSKAAFKFVVSAMRHCP